MSGRLLDGAGVDDGRAYVAQQTGVARAEVEAEDRSRLADDVDQLLEMYGTPAFHMGTENRYPSAASKSRANVLHDGPGCGLPVGELATGDYR